MARTNLLEPGDERLLSAIESILLVAGGPVAVSALAGSLEVSRPRVDHLLSVLHSRLNCGIRLQLHEMQAQLVTAPENVTVVQRFLGTARPPALSRSALEALTVIAYHQPITRPEIEAFRGINSDRAVLTLLARGLIEERGARQSLGRPMEYGTTFGFLEYFGLNSLDQLPPLAQDEGSTISASGIGLRSTRNAEGAPT